MKLSQLTCEFCRDERGATAIEYAMIVSLISVAIMTAVLGVNGGLANVVEDVYRKVTNAIKGGA